MAWPCSQAVWPLASSPRHCWPVNTKSYIPTWGCCLSHKQAKSSCQAWTERREGKWNSISPTHLSLFFLSSPFRSLQPCHYFGCQRKTSEMMYCSPEALNSLFTQRINLLIEFRQITGRCEKVILTKRRVSFSKKKPPTPKRVLGQVTVRKSNQSIRFHDGDGK